MKKKTIEDFIILPTEFKFEKLSSNVTSQNSFLIEVDYNNDISESLRKEINNRFKKSRINKNYKFPRFCENKSLKITRNSTKSPLNKSAKITLNEAKKNRSLSPYENVMSKSTRSKKLFNETLTTSKTPLPMSYTTKGRIVNKLPNLNKSIFDSRNITKSIEITRKKYFK